MRVKLIKNVIENGGVKVSRRRQQPDGTYAREDVFVAGAEIEMSDASAAKYIEQGLAVACEGSPS